MQRESRREKEESVSPSQEALFTIIVFWGFLMLMVLISLAKRQVLRAPLYRDFFGDLTTISSTSLFLFCSRAVQHRSISGARCLHPGFPRWQQDLGGDQGCSVATKHRWKLQIEMLCCAIHHPRCSSSAVPWEEQGSSGSPERPDPLGGRGILVNDCSLIPMSDLLLVVNSCRCTFWAQNWGANPCSVSWD